MPVLWTVDNEIQFHQAAVELAKLRQTPRHEINYRQQFQDNCTSSGRILQPKDEMQLADHIAYIAHSSEGFPEIAAVCIEEQRHPQGLIVRLARNHLRGPQEVEGLRQFLQVLEQSADRRFNKSSTEDRLFTKVLAISEHRILQRLMPSWYPAPTHWGIKEKQKRTSLRHRLNILLIPRLIGREFDSVRLRLAHIVKVLESLDSKQSDEDLQKQVRVVVQCCANASAGIKKQSLEELQLSPILDSLSEAARKVVLQVDKIARYFNLCRDLAKLATKRTYHNVFQNISLKPLLSPPPLHPKGTSKTCYIHAEVQLILYYERNQGIPAPRVIGCSKSSCFLCDLLIQRQRKFRISFSHQRIYPKWTIPNVDWMTNEQLQVWRGIISGMIQDLQSLIERFTLAPRNGLLAPLESRACLPLSSVASSLVTPLGTSYPRSITQDVHSYAPIPPYVPSQLPRPVKLCNDGIPFSRKVTGNCGGFQFSFTRLSIFVEFDPCFSGTISLTTAAEADSSIRGFAVEDLGIEDDLVVLPLPGDEGLGFKLRVEGIDVLYFDLKWDTVGDK